MRIWQTKSNNTAPATSGELTAEEDNARGYEENNVALSAGLTLDPTIGADTDFYMLAQAIARYASGGVYALDTGSANTYVLGGSGAFRMPKAYFDGMRVNWVPGHTNTGASTATAFAIGSVPILNWNAAALTGGEIVASFEASMVYSVANSAFLLVPWMRYAYVSNLIVPTAPQGYLTPVSGGGGLVTDVNGATTLYYTPTVGNLVPIYKGGQFSPTVFAELSLALTASHVASTIYDVFVFSNAGTLTLATGPAWAASGAGAGARGTGAGTTQLSRVNGFWVNTVSMTARNGVTTYTIGAGLGTYLGSIFIDGSAGQVSCHVAYGQSRKWGIWNAYNRAPITLQMGDATGSWGYASATIRQSRADATNKLTIFAGLAETPFIVEAKQNCLINLVSSGSAFCSLAMGIGVDSTTAFSGMHGIFTSQGLGITYNNDVPLSARHIVLPQIGISNINFLEQASTSGAETFNGGNSSMLMTAGWNG